jgi:hypothetical protein
MLAVPNGQNGKGKFVFTITEISALFALFSHSSSTGPNAPRGRLGCLPEGTVTLMLVQVAA